MLDWAMIADDLTGANDSGVQLARDGLKTMVVFDIEAISERGKQYDALVIDTDSRLLPSDEAYDLVFRAAEQMKQFNPKIVYKKMDSTLRGNIGAELDAMYDAYEPEFIVIAPSFPANGRTMENGMYAVHGVPLHESDAAKDPATPVHESHIPTLLAGHTKRQVHLFRTSDLLDERQFALAIEQCKADGSVYLLFDAVTFSDLQLCVERMQTVGGPLVWAGSAGLAQVLSAVHTKQAEPSAKEPAEPSERANESVPELAAPSERANKSVSELEAPSERVNESVPELGESLERTQSQHAVPSDLDESTVREVRETIPSARGENLAPRGPVITVCGSVHQRTQQQLQHMQTFSDTAFVEVRGEVLIAEEAEGKKDAIERAAAQLTQHVQAGKHVVLHTRAEQQSIEATAQVANKHNVTAIGPTISKILGKILSQCIAKLDTLPSGLLLTGGDTARKVCHQLGLTSFELINEVETGIPYGYFHGNFSVKGITKSGGFGGDQSLRTALEHLKEDY